MNLKQIFKLEKTIKISEEQLHRIASRLIKCYDASAKDPRLAPLRYYEGKSAGVQALLHDILENK